MQMRESLQAHLLRDTISSTSGCPFGLTADIWETLKSIWQIVSGLFIQA